MNVARVVTQPGEPFSVSIGDMDLAFTPQISSNRFVEMVGAVRFELTTSCTPSKRAYQATLRPVPEIDSIRFEPVRLSIAKTTSRFRDTVWVAWP